MLLQICKRTLIGGILLIWLIKWVIRPLQFANEEGRYLLNIAPNLLGAFLIPFGAYWLFTGKNHRIAKLFRIHTGFELRMVCLIGFLLVVVNEYLQRIPFFGRTFDYNDLAFSLFGLTASCFVFGYFLSKENMRIAGSTGQLL